MTEPLDLDPIEARVAVRESIRMGQASHVIDDDPAELAAANDDLWGVIEDLVAEVRAWRQVARNVIAEQRAEHPRASTTLDEDVAREYADRDDPLAPFGRKP